MRNIFTLILNIVFFSFVVLSAFAVSTIALTKKVNEYRAQITKGITATVIKQELPVVSFSSGFIKKLYVKEGKEVKKNDLLVEIDNPVLKGKIQALQNYPDNVSAQTEARVAQEEMKGLSIYAPVDGFVSGVTITEGSPVENFSKLMTIYSNENVEVLADLTDDQYLTAQQMHEIKVYSKRLNQDFVVVPDVLRPDTKKGEFQTKQIGLYFVFKDSIAAKSLLNNEDIQLELNTQSDTTRKPIDIFVDFWNSLLLDKKKQ